MQMKLSVYIYALTPLARRLMGTINIYLFIYFRSEGSLNQHVKLKHPQYCFGGVEQFRRPINTAVGEVNSHFRANSAAHTMGLFKDRPTFFD